MMQNDANLVVYLNSTPIWASNTARPTSAPTTPATPSSNAAVNWARGYVGKTHAEGADASSYSTWAPGPYAEWSGDCYYFAYRANVVAGKRPLSGYGTAIATYREYNRRGQIRTDRNPPAGAIVFWNVTSAGHAAVATGTGTVISTTGVDGNGTAVAERSIDSWSNYLGYVIP